MKDTYHMKAVGGAFFVTLLWSSSWVLIKIGLEDISPLVFAGLRYVLAGLILSSRVLISPNHREEIKALNKRWWSKLVIYGILFYGITQGAQFVGLFYLEAITVSFMLNLTPIIVIILSIIILKEYPSFKQILLIVVGFLGVVLFFYPIALPREQILGLTVICIGVVANALSSVIGRSLNQVKQVSSVVITTISMMIGSVILLLSALIYEGIPNLCLTVTILIIWLAVVNTAIAFVIWNHTLQELTAVESSIINSTMLPQITVLAMIFFDERLILKEWIGLILIFFTGLFISLLRSENHKFVSDET